MHKQTLRDALITKRKMLVRDTGAPEAAAARFMTSGLLPAGACVVAAYVATGSEMDTAPLLARLRAAGHDVALPVGVDAAQPLLFRRAAADAAQGVDIHGIPAPRVSQPVVDPDLVVVPLLGFDRRGNRLGRGGGHYDRTLAALRLARPRRIIGLAFDGQKIEDCLAEDHDERLDAVVSERRVYLFDDI